MFASVGRSSVSVKAHPGLAHELARVTLSTGKAALPSEACFSVSDDHFELVEMLAQQL
jgi:hypothetical protein